MPTHKQSQKNFIVLIYKIHRFKTQVLSYKLSSWELSSEAILVD